ncbi:hypothetical protein M0R45_036701 [Rubus argutus]|uniref:Annexin n=1 Tax=Rubus argutus TaxID=59490 RepID=A0AAW1W0D9_RUBAR
MRIISSPLDASEAGLCCGDGDLESLLTMVICCMETPEKHFAQLGSGRMKILNRAIASRAEIDMSHMTRIREEYFKLSETSLVDDVIGDTSRDYKNFLLTLLGERF